MFFIPKDLKHFFCNKCNVSDVQSALNCTVDLVKKIILNQFDIVNRYACGSPLPVQLFLIGLSITGFFPHVQI